MLLDDDTYLDTPASHSIGEIKLVISRSTIPKNKGYKKRTKRTKFLVPAQKVHERSKKAIAHQVKYVVTGSLTLYNA